jgi:uncharacterized protein (DUF58 family)
MNNPESGSLRLTAFGRSVLVLSLAGLVLTLAGSLFDGLEVLPVAPALALLALATAPLLAWLQMRGVQVGAPPGRTVFVGEPFELKPVLENRARWFAAHDLVLGVGDGVRGRMRPVGYLPCLAPQSTRSGRCAWRLPRRGPVSECTLTVMSSFPFGLVERRLVFTLPTELLALPRLGTLRELGSLLQPAAGARRRRTATRQGHEEFFGLRDWREGESPRLVHWKTSARRGRPVVRELEGEDRPPVRIVLSGFVPPPAANGALSALATHERGRPHAGFERAVGLTATLVEHLLRRRYRVSLAFAGDRPWERDLPVTRGALLSALADLARVQPLVRARPVGQRALFERARRRGELAILVDAGPGPGPTGSGRPGPIGAQRARAVRTPGVVLHVDHPSLAELYTTARRGEPRTALLWT